MTDLCFIYLRHPHITSKLQEPHCESFKFDGHDNNERTARFVSCLSHVKKLVSLQFPVQTINQLSKIYPDIIIPEVNGFIEKPMFQKKVYAFDGVTKLWSLQKDLQYSRLRASFDRLLKVNAKSFGFSETEIKFFSAQHFEKQQNERKRERRNRIVKKGQFSLFRYEKKEPVDENINDNEIIWDRLRMK